MTMMMTDMTVMMMMMIVMVMVMVMVRMMMVVMGGESDGAGGIHHVLFLTTNNFK